jgi:hypothetical protein
MSTEIKDYLSEDTLLNEYKFCCISIVSPYSSQKCDNLGVIIRGGYETQEEALERIEELKQEGNQYNIWIGQIGYWLPICFNTQMTCEKQLEELNLNMKNKISTKMKQDNEFNRRKDEMKQKIQEEQDEIKRNLLLQEEQDEIKRNLLLHEEQTAENEDNLDNAENEDNSYNEDNLENSSQSLNQEVNENSNQNIKQVDDEIQQLKITEPIDTSKIINSFDSTLKKNKLKNDSLIDGQSWVCVSFLTPPDDHSDRTVFGLKVRGIFETMDGANELAEKLQKIDTYNHIFVASMCKWLKWDPSPDDIKSNKYENSTLNTIFENKETNKKDLDVFNEIQKKEDLEQSLQESLDESSQNQKEIIDKIFD